jgi:O-antigen/teichoic acid export membrane protein
LPGSLGPQARDLKRSPSPANESTAPNGADPPEKDTSLPPAVDLKPGPPTVGPPALSVGWFVAQARLAFDSVRRLKSVIRLRPFDTTVAEGRSNERYRRAALTTVSSMLAHGLGIFTGLAWIHVSLAYLGKERYGLWMTVGSLVAWANLADFGVARGMQNHLSEANGQDDREQAARYVSTGLVTLSVIAVAFGITLAPVVLLVSWTDVLNIHDPSLASEARYVVAAVLACFLIQFPLSMVPTIYSAYQRGYISSVFNILGSLLSLGALLTVTHIGVSLPLLIFATSGTGILLTFVNFGYAMREMPWLRPRLGLATRKTLRKMASTSLALFVFQIGAVLINQTQSFIIARRLGLTQVADWSVFMRVYTLPFILVQMIDTPLIPAFREAHVRAEHEWLRIAFWRVTRIKMWISVAAAALFVLLGNPVAALIGGKAIVFPWQMWAMSGVSLLIAVWNTSFNDLMIATDRLRLLVTTVLANGLFTPVLSYLCAARFGLPGLVVTMNVFSFAVSGWLLPLACRDLVGKTALQKPRAPHDP